MSDPAKRRLAAIVAADVVDYSRLMGEDQAATLDALRRLRTELIGPAVTGHAGQMVKSMGDGWLFEFDSVSDAAAAALDIQQGLMEREEPAIRVADIHLPPYRDSLVRERYAALREAGVPP